METLDKQAEQLGAEEQPVYEPPFPDYNIAGLDNVWGALLIGIVGTLSAVHCRLRCSYTPEQEKEQTK